MKVKIMQTKKGHDVQIVESMRWQHWNKGIRNAAERTPLDIVVIDNKFWATSCYIDAYLCNMIDDDTIDKYPLPEKWGETINIDNLGYFESEFIATVTK